MLQRASVFAVATAAALVIISNSGMLLVMSLLCVCGRPHSRRDTKDIQSDSELVASSMWWASCCKRFAGAPVCLFSSRRRVKASPGDVDPYEVVGAVMAAVFELTAKLDLTVSDIAAGL